VREDGAFVNTTPLDSRIEHQAKVGEPQAPPVPH